MKLQGFITCDCGKMHASGGITQNSRCTCGRLIAEAVRRIVDNMPLEAEDDD